MYFGHYVYDGKTYLKKSDVFEAVRIARDPLPALSFWFHDNVYSQFDWTKEPDVSLDFLYKERAKQIRDSYDYLVLLYSGGSDSHQALKSFQTANAMSDEVWTVYPINLIEKIGIVSNPQTHYLGVLLEYEHAALPRLKKLEGTKVKVLDSSSYLENYFKINRLEDEMEHYLRNGVFMGATNSFQLLEAEKLAYQMKGKKVGIVYGAEKPHLVKADNKLLFYFTDVGRSAPGTMTPSNFDCVLFFWDPDAPLIPIKQSHVLKNAMRLGLDVWNPEVVKSLIYPSFEPKIFQKMKLQNHDEMVGHFFGTMAQEATAEMNSYSHSFARDKAFSTLMIQHNNRLKVRSRFYNLGEI